MTENSELKIYRFRVPQGVCLGLEIAGELFNLSALAPEFADISAWLSLTDPLAAVYETLPEVRRYPLPENLICLAPLDVQEVWASGVTYLRSKVARREESEGGGDFYDLVYEAERPELFFKSTAQRVAGPGEAVRIRRDSTWDVPEPELALVIAANGNIVGHTIGNDMSSRSIEGENPLYLPQAKVYDGSCALGPGIALVAGETPPRAIGMTIKRRGIGVFSETTTTAQMRRAPAELAAWLYRELSFPQGALLLTGTGIVPPENFTLQAGDVVGISITGIGTLENTVSQ